MQALLLAEQIIVDQLSRLGEMSYTDFCSNILGLELTSGQRAVTRTIFDGKAPTAEDGAKFFGGLTEAPSYFARRTAVAICGRGSGKTRVFLAARALHIALQIGLPAHITANSPPCLVAIVAPNQRQSNLTVGFVAAFLHDRPLLKKILKAEILAEKIRITRPDGRRVSIEARPATSGGDSVRGPDLIAVLMEEAAFFEGEGYDVNDTEIFRAANPRLLPGGQIVFGSTPWAQAGKLWELFRDNFGKPDSAVVCKAPTLLVRPSEDTRRAYEAELKNDPDNARREYDAEFLSADSERFFPETVIQQCLDASLTTPSPVRPGDVVRFGGDFAFASDSSALVGFVEREGKLVCCDIDELRPAPDVPLIPSKVVERFAQRMRAAGCRLLIADDHYREAVQEFLSQYGVALSSVGQTPAHSFVLARTLMAQGQVRIPNHPRLLSQLRRVRSTMKPGGVVTIQQPRAKEGGHGDLVSALVCALSGCSLETSIAKPGPANRHEAQAHQAAKEQEARLKDNQRRLDKENSAKLKGLKSRFGSRLWNALTK